MHLTLLLSLSGFLTRSFSLHQTHGTEQSIIGDEFSAASAIRDVLLENEIICDVLDDFEPSYYIDLAYLKFHEPVMLGNDIPVKAVSKRPAFSFHAIKPLKEDKNLTFTLILTDPDALSRAKPSKSEMCHWIMTNLTTQVPLDPSVFYTCLGGDEVELIPYQPPTPPKKTGKHRYVFVLLEGETANLTAPKERPHWGYGKVRHGVRDWVKDNNLTVVGANFFFAQHGKQ